MKKFISSFKQIRKDRVLCFLISLVLLEVMLFPVIKIAVISGESMEPTLKDRSIHLFLKQKEPQVGDIVSFESPYGRGLFVKRIVAGPGEVVCFQEEWICLSADEYFVLGDNRGYSVDSRAFGPIKREAITGCLLTS